MAVRSAAAAARRLAGRGLRSVGVPTMIQRSRAVSPEAKAKFNTEGRVPRDFFALSPADEAAIDARVEAFLDQALED